MLHSSPVNPEGQMHWKPSSSKKFGLQVEFFTHGELLQGFCIRKKIPILLIKNAAGCLLSMVNLQLQQTFLEICRQFQLNNALAVFNVFVFRFSFIFQLISVIYFIFQLISVIYFRGMKCHHMEVFSSVGN